MNEVRLETEDGKLLAIANLPMPVLPTVISWSPDDRIRFFYRVKKSVVFRERSGNWKQDDGGATLFVPDRFVQVVS